MTAVDKPDISTQYFYSIVTIILFHFQNRWTKYSKVTFNNYSQSQLKKLSAVQTMIVFKGNFGCSFS